jgi:hypothetical protein
MSALASWHADGTPFAMATAPVERAAQAALAIIAAHGQPAACGVRTMSPASGRDHAHDCDVKSPTRAAMGCDPLAKCAMRNHI